MKKAIGIVWIVCFCGIGMLMGQNGFVRVNQGQLWRNGGPYVFMGVNFWYGMNLGSEGSGGDRARLIRELDRLEALEIRNLRLMAASEGPADAPWCMQPALQAEPGVLQEELLVGLDFLLAEMARRDMTGVMCLNNFWPWSGGMAQYVNWSSGDPIPYPPPAEGGDWARYQLYAARFYTDTAAQNLFLKVVKALVTRTNTITGNPYKADPTIMAWQLANEPRGILKPKAYRRWVSETATFIKSLDSRHLVSIGSEGATPSRLAGTRFKKDHRLPGIDYATCHIWVQNWGWFDPDKGMADVEPALEKAFKYLDKHRKQARRMGLPLVLEEFGISRDGNDHSAGSALTVRDAYFKAMFDRVGEGMAAGDMAGCNVWAWGGEGRPREPKAVWRTGDDFIGDPPHEYQGWYSVFDTDTSTQAIMQQAARSFTATD